MKRHQDEPNQNFTALFSVTLVFSMLTIGLIISSIQYIGKLEDYSNEEWSVTRVKEKVVIANDDEDVKYKLELVTHDKAKYSHLFIDQEFFNTVEEKELVQYKITGDDEVTIKHF